ncbi:MAG: hypothetical protein ABI587_15960 [Gemmatimonadales bacterium]
MPGSVFLRSEPDISASLEPLHERLAETVSWCARRALLGPLSQTLRSSPLAPPPSHPWSDTVRAVAEARLQQLGRSWRRSPTPLGDGRLLVYYPTPPHSHGRAQASTDGFFDARDTPPWDTWVAYLEEPERSYLVSWVPPAALVAVTVAMTPPAGALQWLDESGVGLVGRFVAA